MKPMQPTIQSGPPRYRHFAAFAVAVQAIIVDAQGRLLLLSSPLRNGANGWQTVSGGLEAGETILEGVLREVAEEAGPDVQVEPLAVIHARSFHYDDQIPNMIGVYYALRYEGGAVVPGDDMADAVAHWWELGKLETAVAAGEVVFHPSTHLWMLRAAAALVAE